MLPKKYSNELALAFGLTMTTWTPKQKRAYNKMLTAIQRESSALALILWEFADKPEYDKVSQIWRDAMSGKRKGR